MLDLRLSLKQNQPRGYIEHRLKVAGYHGETPLFTDRAISLIAEYSGGIPRNINNICFNAMSLACAMKQKTINSDSVDEVLGDLNLTPLRAALPAADFQPHRQVTPKKTLKRLTAVFPKAWRLRVGVVALGAMLLTGVGLTVVAKNPRSLTASAAPNSVTLSSNAAQAKTQLAIVDRHNSGVSPAGVREDITTVSSAGSHAVPAAPPTKGAANDHGATGAVEFKVVRMGPRDTLYNVCLENLGRYDAQVVNLISELNPGLRSPRRIRTGQEIRIPTPGSLFVQSNLSAKRLGDGSALEAKKP